MKQWIVKALAGSKMDKLWKTIAAIGSGYRTKLVGMSMVVRGLIALVDAMQGTSVGSALDVMRDPSVDMISEGLPIIFLRAGVDKALLKKDS